MDKENNKFKIFSIIVLSVNIFLLFSLLVGWPLIASKFYEMYKDFKMEIPFLAKISLSDYGIFFIILSLILIAKEFIKNKKLSLIINIVFESL